MILLDTDVMIDILRGYQPAIEWLTSVSDQEIGLPGLVVNVKHYGVLKELITVQPYQR